MWLSWSHIAVVLHFTCRTNLNWVLYCLFVTGFDHKCPSWYITTKTIHFSSFYHGSLLHHLLETFFDYYLSQHSNAIFLTFLLPCKWYPGRKQTHIEPFMGQFRFLPQWRWIGYQRRSARSKVSKFKIATINIKGLLPPVCVSIFIYGVSLIVVDLVHPKMSPTLSFSGMHWKPFIYRMNGTNSQ